MPNTRISRRNFIIHGLLAGSALAGSGALARTIQGEIPWLPGQADEPHSLEAVRFFTGEELQSVEAIVARLIPSDENGPGAREANVAGFIDRQLAGFYGRGQRWYMQGPFADGTDRHMWTAPSSQGCRAVF